MMRSRGKSGFIAKMEWSARMIRLKQVLGAGVLLLASAAGHAEDTNYVFDSITAIEFLPESLNPRPMAVTGVLSGDTAPSTVAFPYGMSSSNASSCVEFIKKMLENPGTFTLSITLRVTAVTSPTLPPTTSYSVPSCGLALKP